MSDKRAERTRAERHAAAQRALRVGDAAVAAEMDVSVATVKRWRHEAGLLKPRGRKPAPRHVSIAVLDGEEVEPPLAEVEGAAAGASPTGPVHELVAELRAAADIADVDLPLIDEEPALWHDVLVDDAHHSSAIEGNQATRADVDRIARGETPQQPRLPMRDALEIEGYREAANWTYGNALATPASAGPASAGDKPLLTLEDVRTVHHKLVSSVWPTFPPAQLKPKEGPGSFRVTEIKPFPEGMRPPTHPLVPAEMTRWVDGLNANRPAGHGAVAAFLARAHVDFEQIHPFRDGNGRTGRLLTSMLAIRLGFPPVIVRSTQRRTYLRAMMDADRGETDGLANLIAAALLRGFGQLGVVERLPIDVVPQPFAALASANGLTVNALRNAVARSRLRAVRTPETGWVSTQRWFDAYRTSAHQRASPATTASA